MNPVRIILTAMMLALLAAAAHAATTMPTSRPLISNGDLETDDGHGWPADWPHPAAGASWEIENGNHYLHLKLTRPSQFLELYRVVDLRPGDKAYRLSVRARYKDMHYGKEMWHDGRIMMNFLDKAGKNLGSPPPLNWNKGSADWKTYASEFLVPEGATRLEVMPALIRVPTGELDLDDIALEAIAPEPLLVKQAEQARAFAADVAKQLAGVKATVPPVPADKLPPALHVAGNQIQTADGKPVWLQGVAIPSLEWCEGGEHIVRSTGVAIEDWKANCIRLPVVEKFWFGRGPYRHDGGAQYKQVVEDAVNLCAAHGVYLVLDLHGFGAPTDEAIAFWKNAAQRYKDNPTVLFELFNEPHEVSWDVWRDGGLVEDKPVYTPDVPPEDRDAPRHYTTVGMQRLIDAVRQTGAKNIVIVVGLDWGYDLSGVVKGYALDDRGGSGIVYSSHIYPWKKDWQTNTLDAAVKYPIFVGEVGCPPDYKSFQFIPPEERYLLEGWAPDVIAMIQQHKLNWTGWSFHHLAGPCLLLDPDTYAPTPYWGAFVKDALAGKQFALTKLR